MYCWLIAKAQCSILHHGRHIYKYICLFLCFLFFLVSLLLYQVLSAATIVAKHTSALCNACRLASSKTSNPVARRQFVQSAKEVANTTANLVKTIKVNSPTDQNVECKFVTEISSSSFFFFVDVFICITYCSVFLKNEPKKRQISFHGTLSSLRC